MRPTVAKVLLMLGLVASAVVLGLWGYKHFITDQIKDRGGMVNPEYLRNQKRPADGAGLVYCSVDRFGTVHGQSYAFTLEQDGEQVVLYASYVAQDGSGIDIDGEVVDSKVLADLNTLALSLDLVETPAPEPVSGSEPVLLDGGHHTLTLRWDDGTAVTPDDGVKVIDEFFRTLIASLPDTPPVCVS